MHLSLIFFNRDIVGAAVGGGRLCGFNFGFGVVAYLKKIYGFFKYFVVIFPK